MRYIVRTLYDGFMFLIVYCLGRVPENDTCIAWKIGGPGISRNFYFSMEVEDVYMLFRQHLEEFQLDVFATETQKNIDKPLSESLKKAKAVLTALGGEYTH